MTASDGAVHDRFGVAVAVAGDGSAAVVGAYLHDNWKGAVYVFTDQGGRWTQTAELTASHVGTYDHFFGRAVAVSGDGSTVVVGADDYHHHEGTAYVFTDQGGTWTQTVKLTASDGTAYDGFGCSVSVSGDGSTAVVGAYGNANEAGAAYVYSGQGGTWTQTAELTASDGIVNDNFGGSVAVSTDGSNALVGAFGRNQSTGAAYVYSDQGGTWTQTAELTASDGTPNDYFGLSVAVSGDGSTAVVGAKGHASKAGAAYVYSDQGGTWTQTAELTASDGTPSDYFGLSVAMSGDGSTVVIGAPHDRIAHIRTGAAYVYSDQAGTWTQTVKLTAADVKVHHEFGHSVALSSDGTTAVIGAPHDKTSHVHDGATYVFKG